MSAATAPGAYAERVARTRAAMAEAKVDVLLVDHAEALAWLTGYTVSETMYRAALLPHAGEPWFVLRDLDAAPCRSAVWFADVVGYPDTAEPHAVLAESLRARGHGAARIGADFRSYGFTAATHARLAALLPDAAFVDLPGISDTLRAVKSEDEIARIAQAAGIADATMARLCAFVSEGVSAREAAAEAAAAFLRAGADTGETGPILAARGDYEFLHGAMTDAPLRAGDILHVELIPKVGGYGARLMRPLLVGPARADLNAVAARLLHHQDRQIAAMRPGRRACDVDAILREGVRRDGLRTTYDNVTGYALGLYARTPRPSDFSRVFLPNATWRLEAGMVFHMYVSARGLGFSETVLVTTEGGRRLTTTPRTLLRARPKTEAPTASIPARDEGRPGPSVRR